jgi:hypothetical protein
MRAKARQLLADLARKSAPPPAATARPSFLPTRHEDVWELSEATQTTAEHSTETDESTADASEMEQRSSSQVYRSFRYLFLAVHGMLFQKIGSVRLFR